MMTAKEEVQAEVQMVTGWHNSKTSDACGYNCCGNNTRRGLLWLQRLSITLFNLLQTYGNSIHYVGLLRCLYSGTLLSYHAITTSFSNCSSSTHESSTWLIVCHLLLY
jgi:hypothetical protein